MTVIDVRKDPEALTMTIVSEFDAPVERVWEMWEDPRLLERWWGPPTHPATFTAHDLTPGGKAAYYMTGPDGERFHGWWRIGGVEAPRRLEFEDGFADDQGEPNLDMPPIVTEVTIEGVGAAEAVTRMTIKSTFFSYEAMEQVLEMGAEEGMKLALGQLEELLEEASQAR